MSSAAETGTAETGGEADAEVSVGRDTTASVERDAGASMADAAAASVASGVPVEIWTDGGCKPNPGPGGWAAILRFNGRERELTGGERATTNNRMELTAAAAALEALTRPCKVVLHTDSEYVRNGISRWVHGWVRNGWKNAAKDPVANYQLWQRLLAAAKPHQVEWRWVRGHAGDPMNERADRLATLARDDAGA